jgi:transposase InsO family protein
MFCVVNFIGQMALLVIYKMSCHAVFDNDCWNNYTTVEEMLPLRTLVFGRRKRMCSNEHIGLAGARIQKFSAVDVRFVRLQHGVAPRHGQMCTYEDNGAGDRIHIDLTGPHPTSRQGHTYITAIDAYTRYLVAVPLRNKMAVTVANALVEHVFLPLGAYRSLVSDQGREFCNEILEEVTHVGNR